MTTNKRNEELHEQLGRVRDRFTRTAAVFSEFVLAERGAFAERLVTLTAPKPNERALDLACGPGTLAREFAPRVGWVCGVDVTPAMLELARKTARQEQLSNFFCCCGDAIALPFADGSLDIIAGSYCLHHLADPAAVIRELARVLRPGGRVGLLDNVVPDDPERAAASNRIERGRDASHTRTLSATEIERMVEAAGFRVRAKEPAERPRRYDNWMRVAGWKRGDSAYEEGRRLLEESIPGDRAAFEPRVVATADGGTDIEIVQKSLFIVGERLPGRDGGDD
jgi:ubiquinone/menaquinone biosynthesis C-methylase UbiE